MVGFPIVPMPRYRTVLATAAVLLAAFAPTACARPFPRDPIVVQLVEALATGERGLAYTGETITAPPALVELIALGKAAVPTLLDLLPTRTEEWILSGLLEALGRSGDARACAPIEDLLQSPSRDVAQSALDAVERLAQTTSIPVLRSLLARPDRGGFGRARLLGALLRVDDETALEPLIELGLAMENERWTAVQALLHHKALRTGLGMREMPHSPFVADEEQFLRAAQEWAVERRGARSPWREAADFVFSAPFADEKQQGFELARKAADSAATVRCVPVDVVLAVEVPSAPLAVLSCWGHGHGLTLDVWEPRAQTARLHRFSVRYGDPRTTFAEDVLKPHYERAEVPMLALQRVTAGMRAALASRIIPWWHSDPASSFSSSNFGIVLLGTASPDAMPAFCGYANSGDAPRYAPLEAARDWHLRAARDAACTVATPDEATRALFADHWLRSLPRWDHDEHWWFVRERAVALAGAFGTAALVPHLRPYLDPRYAAAGSSLGRTAARACTALATLTGVDRRFDANGSPRPTADAAQEYRAQLDGR